MRNETILREAEFNPRVVDYWLLSGTIVLAIFIVTIPVAILWYFAGRQICNKYLARISCTLTDRSLIIKKGMFNRIEKTIPLDKITDLAMLQGPIMRAMDLKGFKVETAGGGAGPQGGYLVQLTGIVDTEGFRDAVLAQRDAREDRLVASPAAPPAPAGQAAPSSPELAELIREFRNYAPKPNGPGTAADGTHEMTELLRDIRDSLKAIEARGS